MVKLADTPALGAGPARGDGSSPSDGTISNLHTMGKKIDQDFLNSVTGLLMQGRALQAKLKNNKRIDEARAAVRNKINELLPLAREYETASKAPDRYTVSLQGVDQSLIDKFDKEIISLRKKAATALQKGDQAALSKLETEILATFDKLRTYCA